MNTAFHRPTGVKPKPALPALACVRPRFLQCKCACGGTPGLGGECEGYREKREDQLQQGASGTGLHQAPLIVQEVLRSPGQPLDPATRAFMEPRFGHDFKRVQIHTGAKAAESARAVGAHAYTVGNEIVFGAGRYALGSNSGQRLLAHELTHVVQQRSINAGGMLKVATADDAYEQQADTLADQVVSRQPLLPFEDDAGMRTGNELPVPPHGPARFSGFRGGLSNQSVFWTPGLGRPMVQRDADSDDYAQGYQDGLKGEVSYPGPRDSDALTDYNEGYAKGRYEFGQQSLSGGGTSGSSATGETSAQPDKTSANQTPQAQTVPARVCTPPSYCPPEFCAPLPRALAELGRFDSTVAILAGIGAAVSPRVVPLWKTFIWGGTSTVQDLSTNFGKDFTNDPITSKATSFLKDALATDLTTNPLAFPPGTTSLTIDIVPRIGPALAKLRSPSDPDAMEFTGTTIPGNLAGGIGLDEAACPVGSAPSSQNDDRRAEGSATITREPNGTLTVNPSITFTVDDTIDFCPGNCGTGFFTVKVTTLLSRWEATGISGDVPITVKFPSPPIPPISVTPASTGP